MCKDELFRIRDDVGKSLVTNAFPILHRINDKSVAKSLPQVDSRHLEALLVKVSQEGHREHHVRAPPHDGNQHVCSKWTHH